jgi:hypothetical protein
MYQELQKAGGQMSNYIKRYVLNLYNYLNRARRLRPGVAGPPEDGFLSYSCNVFQNRIIGFFGIISEQFARAGINEREALVATIFENMLPSNLRKHIFRDEDFGASTELGILAFRLTPGLIDCLAGKLGGDRRRAQELLDQCPLFASTLTEANLETFVQMQPDIFLRAVLNIPLTRPDDYSQAEYGGSQRPDQRLETLRDDLLDKIRRNPETFILAHEIEETGGMKRALKALLNVNPLAMCSNGLKVAKTKFMQDVIAADLPLFERVAAPQLLSRAHQKFLPLENLLTGMTHRVFSQVTDIIENWDEAEGELTDDTIRQIIFERLQREFDYHSDEGFDQVMETAFCGFKVGTLWNPIRCSFTPTIVFKNGKPLAVMVVDIESTTTEVNRVGFMQDKYLVPFGVVESAKGLLGFLGNSVNKISGAIGAICQSVAPPSTLVAPGTVAPGTVALDTVRIVTDHCNYAAKLAEALKPVSESGGPAVVLDAAQLGQVNEMCNVLQQQIPVEFQSTRPEIDQTALLKDFKDDERRAQEIEAAAADSLLKEAAERVVGNMDDSDTEDEETAAAAEAVGAGMLQGSGYVEEVPNEPAAVVNMGDKETLKVKGAAAEAPAEAQPAAADQAPAAAVVGNMGDAAGAGAGAQPVVPEDDEQIRNLKRGSENVHLGGKPRTRRRRSSSSTRSSTTRGRKSKSRRNQSKKHKQNSRRQRRNSRKASRKN